MKNKEEKFPISKEEIEITPEMIEAGVRRYCAGDTILETHDEIVESIFHAMWAARNEGLGYSQRAVQTPK